jgi:hypothetical protein
MNIKHIIQGHANVILSINDDLSKYRIENACKKCSISHNKQGEFTNKCIRANGGCGCPLHAATSVKGKRCPKDIWYDETIDFDKLKEFEI